MSGEVSGMRPRITRIKCPECQQLLEGARLLAMGFNLEKLADAMYLAYNVESEYGRLRAYLASHQAQHDCCHRGHDCKVELPVSKPAWYPW